MGFLHKESAVPLSQDAAIPILVYNSPNGGLSRFAELFAVWLMNKENEQVARDILDGKICHDSPRTRVLKENEQAVREILDERANHSSPPIWIFAADFDNHLTIGEQHGPSQANLSTSVTRKKSGR
jgi:hypothetical protein